MANKTKGKDPAVLFYTSDFLSGTYTMDYPQRGKYITLLCIQHQKGFLTRQELEYISEGEEAVIDKFTEIEGKYYNIKMYNETIRRKEYTENRLKNFHKKAHKDSLMETHTETVTVTEAATYKLLTDTEDRNEDESDTKAATIKLENKTEDRNESKTKRVTPQLEDLEAFEKTLNN